MIEPSIAQKKRERYRLEGALGYCLRIAEKMKKKSSLDELSKVVQEDFERVSAALSHHCRDDLQIAGFGVGLLIEDENTEPVLNEDKPASNREKMEKVGAFGP